MLRIRTAGPIIALALSCVVPIDRPVCAQTSDDNNAKQQSGDGARSANESEANGRIRFNFKNASFDEVLDFFSRVTGKPIVKEADVPQGAIDYLSPKAYTEPEALRVLNIILQARGVMLRVEDDMLYLQKLEKMQRENVPTFVQQLPDDVTPDQIVTVVRPLTNAMAQPLAEQLSQLVADYGSVTSLPEQNALVITETAAQVRRMLKIINQIDLEDPEGQVEIFKIRHTDAQSLMEPLKSLLTERIETIKLDNKKRQVKVEEQRMVGINLSADPRTNSIIAKGTEGRVAKVREMLDLLDVPSASDGRSIRTIDLAAMSPADAAKRLNELYNNLPKDERPNVIMLNDLGRVTIVGSQTHITEGVQLIREIDPGGGEIDVQSRQRMEVITLDHAQPSGIISALKSLLNGRQVATTKLVAGPEGESIVVAGSARDISDIRQTIEVLDRPADVDRRLRMMQLDVNDPQAVVDRAHELYNKKIDEDEPAQRVEVELDAQTGLLTLIGANRAIDDFSQILHTVRDNIVIERETQQIDVTNAKPSEIVQPLRSMAKQILQSRDETKYIEPEIEPIDALDQLIITAPPDQFNVLRSLVTTLDRPDPSDYQFRVVSLASVQNVETLLERAAETYDTITQGYEQDELPAPETRFDATTGNLTITGQSDSVQMYERALSQARNLLPPDREGKMIELTEAQASDVIEPLRELLSKSQPIQPGRQIPEPAIEVIERTNSLYVTAEPAQHKVIERYVRKLDTLEPQDLPPMRLLQVRAAEAGKLANLLRDRYNDRPAEQRREQPVEVTADQPTNTLIVTAHDDVFNEIKSFVEEVNESGETGAERETMIFPLERAKATDLAKALQQLYPEPPMPRDRWGRPLPHLQEPKEVHVSAEDATNTLIIEAPVERRPSFEALVEKLDRIDLPPAAELRTYRLERGDPKQIERTLNNLADRNVMRKPAAEGGKAVEVFFTVEPKSRTLIVAGDEVTFRKTEEVLSNLKAVPVQRSLRVFELPGADLETIAQRAQKLYKEQTKGDPEAGEVTIEVDRDSSTLLVVADDESMVRFASILNELQQTVSPPPDVRLIALEFAEAQEVVQFLAGMSGSEMSMLGQASGPPPMFQAIDRTNSVLVAAQPDQHKVIRSLIDNLDVVEDQELPPIRILQVRMADASNIASALMQQYNKRPAEDRNRRPVNITADQQTNSLIVAAHPEMFAEIQAVVEDLNEQSRQDYEGREIRIFPLKVARAEQLAQTIDEMFPEPPVPRDRWGRPLPHLQKQREVVVRGDAQTNSLIVDAPVQRMAEFENLVEQLDRQEIAADTEVRTYEIVHAELNAVERTLNELSNAGSLNPAGGDQRATITITTEPMSNTLIVSGPSAIFERVEQVLSDLDARPSGPATALRFFKLDAARAESLAPMLREVLMTRISEDVPEAGSNTESLLNVTADNTTNTLIISAPEAIMPVAEQLIKQLDDSSAKLERPTIRVQPLTFADARDVTESLSNALPGMVSEKTGEPIDVDLIASPGSNAIILVGRKDDLERVEKLIQPLDERPAMDEIDAKTYALEHGDAKDIAPILQRLLTDQMANNPWVMRQRIIRTRGRHEFDPQVRVEADERTNSVIVSGTQRTVALAEVLLESLDRPDDRADRVYKTFTPGKADLDALAQTVQRVLKSTLPEAKQSKIELIADRRAGVIVVIGPEQQADEALDLLAKWDEKAMTPPQMDLRVVTLEHSEADMLARTLTPMLRDQTRWPHTLRAMDRAGLRIGQPSVSADSQNNRLLISAPASLMPVASEFIEQLDQPRTQSASVELRIFHLDQSDARQVADAVRQGLQSKAKNNPNLPDVQVTAEPSSNALLVTAASSQLDEAQQIIEQLDAGMSPDQAQVRTVFLKHGRAENVAPLVEQLLGAQEVVNPDRLPAWARVQYMRERQQQMEQMPDVRVVADERLNAVVIAGPATVLNIAEEMVQQLDQDAASVGGAGRQTVRVLTINNADAQSLADNIETMFEESEGAQPPPAVQVDRSSNSLLVRATDEQFKTIENVVNEVDRATLAGTRQMRRIAIDPSRASAEEIATILKRMLERSRGSSVKVMTLEELMEQYKSAQQAPPEDSSSFRYELNESQKFFDTPKPLSHWLTTLVIAAAPENTDDKDGNGNDESDSARPSADEALASQLISALDEAGDMTIAVDEQTNSLILFGSERSIDRVASLADQLQDQLPAEPGDVRYIALPDAVDARNVRRMVQQTLRQMTPPGGRRGEFFRRVSVMDDRAANALIVVANDRDFEMVGELISTFAQPPSAEQMLVKVYPLETITADRAASSVRDLINVDGRGRRNQQAARMRSIAIESLEGEKTIESVFDPQQINFTTDSHTNTLIVMAPQDAVTFLDQFVSMLDQSRIETQTNLKVYDLKYAAADELQGTLRRLFRSRVRGMRQQGMRDIVEPEFVADDRTNTLLVTASPEMMKEAEALIENLDQQLAEDRYPLRTIELTSARAQHAAQILERTVLGTDQKRRTESMIVPDDDAGVLLVRASEQVNAEIDRVLKEIDRDATSEYEIRSITVEHADAATVAQAIQQFYEDLARVAAAGRGGRSQERRVSIIGDPNSRTLLVAASDEDFEEIERLVKQFDTKRAAGALEFRVFPLEHAEATQIQQTVQGLVNDLTWNQGPMIFSRGRFQQSGGDRRQRGVLAVRADQRLNALIVTGEGDKFDIVQQMIDVLDVPKNESAQRTVRLYSIESADIQLIRDVVEQLYADADRAWWEPADPTAAQIRVDERSNTLVVSALPADQEEIAKLIEDVDQEMAPADHTVEVLSVEFAQANEMARTLMNFLRDRARATNQPQPSATITASQSANALVVSANENDLNMIGDLLDRLDQPDVSGDRAIEIVALQDAEAREIGRIVETQFGGRGGRGVKVTADGRTNSLIINAPSREFAQIKALIDRLDAPAHSDETVIRTYALEGARAEEARRILGETLQLDRRGRTEGVTIKLEGQDEAVEITAQIVADRRSNSLIVTATEQSFPVIENLIEDIDDVPAQSAVEFRIVQLEHVLASDISFTLGEIARSEGIGDPRPRIDYNAKDNQLIIAATPDQFKQFQQVINELDQPSPTERVTEFVPLEYAQAENVQEALSVFYGDFAPEADTPAERNVRIVADPATNSLVISAEERAWDGIRSLLKKLDSEEYDSSLQLRVLPLRYADASSVARAINDAFQSRLERDDRARDIMRRQQQRGEDGRREAPVPTMLVEAQEWVRASAEPQTNSVVVSASRQTLRKIEDIVNELDVADYAKLPAPRLIAVTNGDPQEIAESLRTMYQQQSERQRSRRTLRIVGNQSANAIIVRAEADEFEQIKALADALQQEAAAEGLGVHVLELANTPAARIAQTLRQAYSTKAEQSNQPLSIQVDATGNSLVIACTAALLDEIRDTVDQLDQLSPAAGQGIFIIELENISPDEAQNVVETIGLTQPQPADSVSKLVTEPIKIAPLNGRNAVIIVANPVDREQIVGILKAVDEKPDLAEAQMRIVRLKNAEASAVADVIQQVLSPGDQQTNTALARAIQEQVRRLSVRRDGAADKDLKLDLTKPVRVIANQPMNALIISSTPSNVKALASLARTFDKLPLTDAVTVQLFPLENISADAFAGIVDEIFEQGKSLGDVPGTNITGIPGGMVGGALLHDIAISTDERTNTLIAAGTEEAVALIEVLSKKLDSEVHTGWVEPRVIRLQHADAQDLAETLQEVIVEGSTDLPQANPLQRQIGRLRMARMDENGGRVLEADVFQPMTRLVIRPQSQLNALILVGTPKNLEVITELVGMLDIEAASPSAAVRIYPVEHASASRLANTVTQLFDQQVQSKAIRPEDRVIVQADERTNSLIVTTSPRSFTVLERLLETLDREVAPDLRAIRRIKIENASATRLAELIQEMMDARLERLQRVQPETADLQKVTVVADPRTNSLVVAAGNESFEVVQRLAEDLDSSTLGDDALIEAITIESGNVERLAEIIESVMERRYADMSDQLSESQQPLVMTDARTNSLLIAANPEDMKAIENLIAKLEAAPTNPAVGLHVVDIGDGMRAEQLADRLERLMQQRRATLGEAETPSDRVTVEADPASNSLIVAASDENLEAIRNLITVLQRAEREKGEFDVEVIPLASSRAENMVNLLEDLYVREANRRRGEDVVQVTADERLNAVLINAPSSDVNAIRDLVDRLDKTRPAQVVEVKYIPLSSANALETVSLIQNVLSGRGLSGRRATEQSTVLKYLQEIEEIEGEAPGEDVPEMQAGAAITENITLTPDLRTNTVIVAAPSQSMRVIEKMITDLDETSIGSQNIRIFDLENADATAMAEIITDLFNLTQQGNLYVLKPREDVQPSVGAGGEAPGESALQASGLSGADLTAVPDQRQQLSITVDSRTNSLLVSGTPKYLDLVEQVVSELDTKTANERETLVYPLRNAVAEDVARVISDFVATEQQKLIQTLGTDELGSASRLLEREVTIVGDEKSNTVLVSASPRYMGRVEEMIKELDVDPPQVLIQVLLAEVTLDTSDEWGFDMNAEGEVGEFDVAGGFGLASAFVTGMGVPNVSVSSDDFNLLFRALQSQGRVQVLSNPSIMTANNEEASLQVGETIRVPESTSFTNEQQFSSVVEEDLGIILNVTPQINPDGFVRMDIRPEISELLDRTTQISEDFQSPVISRRNADTVITVKDGQTVVLGGLISDRFERRLRQVPFLGDLPVLGRLFQSETETTTKTELLIVLTPHVVKSPAALSGEMTDREIDRLSVPEDIKDQIRRGTIEGTLFDEQGNPITDETLNEPD